MVIPQISKSLDLHLKSISKVLKWIRGLYTDFHSQRYHRGVALTRLALVRSWIFTVKLSGLDYVAISFRNFFALFFHFVMITARNDFKFRIIFRRFLLRANESFYVQVFIFSVESSLFSWLQHFFCIK